MTDQSSHHDHDHCVATALDTAERICDDKGARLTDLRRRVLELVWSRHTPITAYEVLDLLKGERGSAAPPTVYRALDFLLDQGLIHRIESLNAFIGCISPNEDHRGGFFICSACHAVDEIRDCRPVRDSIRREAEERNFQVTASMVEVIGLCASCRSLTSLSGQA